MKRIEFKKLPKDILEEGITIELLNKVQDSGKFSPAMMQKGDEPVTLIKANSESFWIQLEDGSFLKDKGKLMVFDLKTCLIARARYWTLFSNVETAMGEKRREEAKQKEIDKEVERIKADVKKQAESVISKYREIEKYAGLIRNDFLDMIKNINPEGFRAKEEAAKQFISENPELKELINSIESKLTNEDFDSLYILLKTDGLPLIASIDNDNNLELLKRFFHRDKIEKTVDTIQHQNHIRNVAMFNVNKRYS